jgi:hypothetical protein
MSRPLLAAASWLLAALLTAQADYSAMAQELRCNPECEATLKGLPTSEIRRNCCTSSAAPSSSTGQYCDYEKGLCAMIQANPAGLACLCPGPNGPLSGKIVRESTSNWSYGVYWCTDKPENDSVSLYIEQALRRTLPREVTRVPWTAKDNEAPNFKVSGLVVRHADRYAPQAAFVQALLAQQVRRKAELVKAQSSRADFIGVFVCGVPPRLPD